MINGWRWFGSIFGASACAYFMTKNWTDLLVFFVGIIGFGMLSYAKEVDETVKKEKRGI